MNNDILSVDQVAKLLGCTKETVDELARDAKLPGLKFGRPWVFPREALIEVLTAQALEYVRNATQKKNPRRQTPPPLS